MPRGQFDLNICTCTLTTNTPLNYVKLAKHQISNEFEDDKNNGGAEKLIFSLTIFAITIRNFK